MAPGDIAFKSNFATLDPQSGIVVRRRADRRCGGLAGGAWLPHCCLFVDQQGCLLPSPFCLLAPSDQSVAAHCHCFQLPTPTCQALTQQLLMGLPCPQL